MGEPSNAKFRRLRLSNAKVQASVMDVPGALELLQAAGFRMVFEEVPDGEGGSEGWLVLPEHDAEALAAARAGCALLQPLAPPLASEYGPAPYITYSDGKDSLPLASLVWGWISAAECKHHVERTITGES